MTDRGGFPNAQPRSLRPRIHPEDGSRNRGQVAATPYRGRDEVGRHQPRGATALPRGAAGKLLSAGPRISGAEPGLDALRRAAGGYLSRLGAEEFRLHAFTSGATMRAWATTTAPMTPRRSWRSSGLRNWASRRFSSRTRSPAASARVSLHPRPAGTASTHAWS